jgi:hypothetical protein
VIFGNDSSDGFAEIRTLWKVSEFGYGERIDEFG